MTGVQKFTGTDADGCCPYCGMIHKSICPRIKSVEYSDMNPGLFKRVEFFAPNDYPPIMQIGKMEAK